MKRFSTKRAAQERRLREIEKRLRAKGETTCFFLSHQRGFTYDHVVPKSANAALIDCEDNLVPISDEAHYIITFGTAEQMKKLPNFNKYLEKMKSLDERYWRRFMTNHDLWDEGE